ncbi:MAG: NADH-quinone oxidoreductase subunit H, partial [Candidatus Makaraimicrobium thalassicum]
MIGILFKILQILIIAISGMVVGLFCKGIDRILAARMQYRVGPPLVQPFMDVKKLLVKESIVSNRAVKWIFDLMPVVALSASIIILLYLPLGGMGPLLEGDGDVMLVLYLFIVPALAMILGGFSSGSPYAHVGSEREMIKLMSFELPLTVVIVSIVWLLSFMKVENAFSLSVISGNPVWGLVGPVGFMGLLLLLLILLFVVPGEMDVVPFDVPTAGSEIAGGVLVEYSGRNLALFYLADAVKLVAIS